MHYGRVLKGDIVTSIASVTLLTAQGSLNTRINILYFLDSLLEACQPLLPGDAPYLAFTARDLPTIVQGVVPDAREGILNLKSARQVRRFVPSSAGLWNRRRGADSVLDSGELEIETACRSSYRRASYQRSRCEEAVRISHESAAVVSPA